MLYQKAWLSSPRAGIGASGQAAPQLLPSCLCRQSPLLRMLWLMAPWPVPKAVTEKTIAQGFPYWRHDFIASLPPSVVYVYTACFCSWGPLMLNDQAGGKHTFTECLAWAPWGRITKKRTILCQARRWIIDSDLEGTSSFHPLWEFQLQLAVHILDGETQKVAQMERTQFRGLEDMIWGLSNATIAIIWLLRVSVFSSVKWDEQSNHLLGLPRAVQ